GPFSAGFRAVGSFELFFPGDDFEIGDTTAEDAGADVDYWEANVNVVYDLLPLLPITPYVGGGLVFAHTEITGTPDGLLDRDATDTGLNLLAGVELDAGSATPFVEVRLEIDGGDQWVVTGGIVF
ncbi:MAG: hypothetical protein R3266_05510, partial [Gemmatimonadota bacterium]|nr:hypothetical protein [Gemmatimonadota bacterium]